MTSIRRTFTALTIAAALGVPAFASAEQAPFEACDGNKAEQKDPTAERAKQESDKTNAPKPDDKNKSEDQRAPNQGKTS